MTEAQVFDDFLVKHGLRSTSEPANYFPLTGGVSSEIYRVDLPGRSLCMKRALAKLKVAATWEAPISRSAFEWEWISFVSGVAPDSVPTPLAYDPELGLFAMSYLDPHKHPVWKSMLLSGQVEPDTAKAIGRLVGRIHAASTREPGLSERFASDGNFHTLRLEPYLEATALRHPNVSRQLFDLMARTASTKIALIHGDVSPKNILVGPKGPVILDAECAWFGDPAFDLAFCLNHLLLKCILIPEKAVELRTSFDGLCTAYLAEVTWEAREALEARASSLLPALFLARIDGKSPVEYVNQERQRAAVRDCAIPLIRLPTAHLQDVAEAWYTDFMR